MNSSRVYVFLWGISLTDLKKWRKILNFHLDGFMFLLSFVLRLAFFKACGKQEQYCFVHECFRCYLSHKSEAIFLDNPLRIYCALYACFMEVLTKRRKNVMFDFVFLLLHLALGKAFAQASLKNAFHLGCLKKFEWNLMARNISRRCSAWAFNLNFYLTLLDSENAVERYQIKWVIWVCRIWWCNWIWSWT